MTARVLLLTPYSPSVPHDHAAQDVMPGLVRALATRVELFVYTPGIAAVPRAVADTYPGVTFLPSGVMSGRTPARHLGARPSWMRKEWPRAATREVAGLVRTLRPDVVHGEYVQSGEPLLAGGGHRRTVTLHDVTTQVAWQLADGASGVRRLRRRADFVRTASFEAQVVQAVDHVFALSEGAAAYARAFGVTSTVTPPGVSAPQRLWEPSSTPVLTFTGALWRDANVAAARFLVEDVMPIVWRRRPDVTMRLAGARPGRAIRRLGEGDVRVEVVADVPDLADHLCLCSAVVAPAVVHGGVLLKIVNAMAHGAPVVTDVAGAGPLGLAHGRHALVADGAAAFADAVLDLVDRPATARQVGLAGRSHVLQTLGWGTTADRYVEGMLG